MQTLYVLINIAWLPTTTSYDILYDSYHVGLAIPYHTIVTSVRLLSHLTAHTIINASITQTAFVIRYFNTWSKEALQFSRHQTNYHFIQATIIRGVLQNSTISNLWYSYCYIFVTPEVRIGIGKGDKRIWQLHFVIFRHVLCSYIIKN